MWYVNAMGIMLVAMVVIAVVEWVDILVIEPLKERRKFKKKYENRYQND